MRPRQKNRHLPACVHHKHGAYYYVKGGKWEPLGKNLNAALARYAERLAQPKGGMPDLIDAALPHILSTVSKSTGYQYKAGAKKLKKIMRLVSPRQVTPSTVAQVKRLMGKTPNMANTCLTVLKRTFDYAVEEQLLDANPAYSIKPYKVQKRTRLISAEEFTAIYEKASPELQIAMDLWRLTGQRVMDAVRIRRADLRDDGVYFKQKKTGKELIVSWNPELRAVVDRAIGLYGNVRALTLLHNRRGKPLGYKAVLTQWRAACNESGVEDAQQRDMRAMALTAARRQGIDPTALAAHTDRKTTEIYLRDREIPVVEGPSFRQVIDIRQKGTKEQ